MTTKNPSGTVNKWQEASNNCGCGGEGDGAGQESYWTRIERLEETSQIMIISVINTVQLESDDNESHMIPPAYKKLPMVIDKTTIIVC